MISVSAHARLTNGTGGVDGIDCNTPHSMMPAVRWMPAAVAISAVPRLEFDRDQNGFVQTRILARMEAGFQTSWRV
jgi:hypothetical protein